MEDRFFSEEREEERSQRQEGQVVRRRIAATDKGKTSKGVSPRNLGV